MKVATGSVQRGKSERARPRPRVVVAFDPETFESVRGRASRDGTSFGEQVRQLVERGLLDAEVGEASR